MKLILVLLTASFMFLTGCEEAMPPDAAPGVDYDADMYVCGEPPNDVLFTCVVGTGPPRQDCGAKQSGTTQTAPIIC